MQEALSYCVGQLAFLSLNSWNCSISPWSFFWEVIQLPERRNGCSAWILLCACHAQLLILPRHVCSRGHLDADKTLPLCAWFCMAHLPPNQSAALSSANQAHNALHSQNVHTVHTPIDWLVCLLISFPPVLHAGMYKRVAGSLTSSSMSVHMHIRM